MPAEPGRQLAGLVLSVLVALGGGGGLGYYAGGGSKAAAAEAPRPVSDADERLAALETWQAGQIVREQQRDRERGEHLQAMKDLSGVLASTRDVMLAAIERLNALDARVQAVERRRH